jgi:ABC-type lipoprotein release transport system permease subunit
MNLRLWWGMAWRFLWRSQRSTAALTAMIVSAVATLIFLDALAVGVSDAMIRNSVSLVSGHVTAENIPADVALETLLVPGVKQVLQRRTAQVWLLHDGRLAGTSLWSVDPDAEKNATALWRKTTSGRYPLPGKAELFLGEPVAEELGLAVGDTLLVTDEPGRPGRELELCGTFSTGIAALDRSLSFSPMQDNAAKGPWNAALFLADGAAPEAVRNALRLPAETTVRTWAERMPDLKQLIDLNALCMILVMILVFFIVSLGIACAFVIFILKNIREHGIMKSMGVHTHETALLLMLQIGGLTLAASALGMVIGGAATLLASGPGLDLGAMTSHNQYFAVSGVIFPRLTLSGLVLPPLMALLFALLAGIWPVCMVARQRPAEVLRSI